MEPFGTAKRLLQAFKGDRYLHGVGIVDQVGPVTAELGSRVALVWDRFPGAEGFVATLRRSLAEAGVTLVGEVAGAAPNAPREDLARITAEVSALAPDVVVSFGGGSTIDATKAAIVLSVLGGSIEAYFGTGLVTAALQSTGKHLIPHVAIQTASSSGAHLTKYSNITDVASGQKKLIVDEAVVPTRPVFDYQVTFGAPPALTADGALDGVSHCLEVLYGAMGKPSYEAIEEVAQEGIRLVTTYLPRVLTAPNDAEGREALGLATDLGAYAIMLGGTNGGHLTSFSLVDILSHGRACAIMNPYYSVFFAPAIERPLRTVGSILSLAGYSSAELEALHGRELGMAVAEALIAFQQAIGFPTQLSQVAGFTEGHIERALHAAKQPELKMKLENMPVPLSAADIDGYMRPILEAARDGKLELIRTM